MSDRIMLWQALIPGGQAAAVETLARVSFFPSGSVEHETSVLLAVAAALLCADRSDASLVASVEQRAAAIPELRGSSVLVQGLLAARRGQRESARLLLESIEEFDPARVPPFHRQIAVEWLVGEALDRRDDARAAELHRLRWLVPSTRSELIPWLRIVWPSAFTRDGVVVQARPALWTVQATTLSTAVLAHAAVFGLAERDVTTSDVERLALAWRNALRDELTQSHLRQRSLAAGDVEGTLLALRLADQLRDDFALLLRASSARWGDVLEISEPLIEALHVVRQEALREVEEMAERLERRVDDERALPSIDEWLDWQTLRVAYERLVSAAEPEDRKLAFAAVNAPVGSLGVWLANKRDQRPASHAVFRWLLREATAAGDRRAMELQGRNVEITRQ